MEFPDWVQVKEKTLYMHHAIRRSPVDKLRNSTWIKEEKNNVAH